MYDCMILHQPKAMHVYVYVISVYFSEAGLFGEGAILGLLSYHRVPSVSVSTF